MNRAGDFVILSRGCAAEALEFTARTMERTGLTLKREKTKLVKAAQKRFDFLGYTFGPHRFKSFQIVSNGFKQGWPLVFGGFCVEQERGTVEVEGARAVASGRSGALGGAARPAEPGVGGLAGLLFSWDPADGLPGGGRPRE